MESDLDQHPPMFLEHHHHHHHHLQLNSGLTRFRSAPSSYFSNIIDKEFYDSIFNKPSSPETERIFARFMNSLTNDEGVTAAATTEQDSSSLDNKNLAPVQQQQIPVVKQEVVNNNNNLQPQDFPSMNNETVILQQQQQQQQSNIGNSYGSSGAPHQSFYQSSGRPPLPNQMKTGRGSASNLMRHGSSPAGFFSNINIEGYVAAIRGMGTMGAGSNSTSEDANFSPATRLKKKNAQGYSSSSSGLMSPIAEIGNTSNRMNNNTENEAFGENQQQENDFISGLPVSSWNDSSSMISDNITGLKRYREEDVKPFSGLNAAPETQNETGQAPAASLSHQLSLPNTSSEIAAIEKFLNCSSDSVLCKIRAKRGCATHPRSIAERVRRTKISERMRKLQDLVPNMDKQTNTADMLDLAVEYIKDLQNQVEILSDNRAKCTCSHKQQHQ